MRQYRPRRRGSRNVRFNSRLLLIICAAIAAVVVVVIIVNVNKGPKKIDPTDTFASNVTVQGVSVGGMTASEARVALNPEIKDMMAKALVQIKVPAVNEEDQNADEEDAEASDSGSSDEENADEDSVASENSDESGAADEASASQDGQIVEYTASEAGITVDVDAALQQAMEYSLSGDAPKKSEDDAPIADFTMLYAVDESTLTAALQKDASAWSKPAQNASYTLKTTKDEDGLTTSAEPVKQDGIPGSQVDVAALTQQIENMVASQIFQVIEAPVTELPPEKTAEDLGEISVIGTYSTSFSSSPSNRESRMYNIWKISSILNGTRIPAGENISVNEIVGPRTEEGGWALAPGIENGEYKDQPGGGICQVSTTLYIAALKAELKILDRTHHTYPSAYVPMGLDATISTDEPDLKLENNTEYPVLIGINCDVSDRTVEVNIYGVKPRDYTLRFENVVVQTTPPTPDTYVADATVAPNTTVQRVGAHTGYVVDIYKIWYDKDGNEYDRKRIYTDTYKPSGAIIAYNPATPPVQVTSPSAAPIDPNASATPVPETPTPTPSPTESTAPTESPSASPDPGASPSV